MTYLSLELELRTTQSWMTVAMAEQRVCAHMYIFVQYTARLHELLNLHSEQWLN
jgi:hypothetical protein